MRVVWILFQDIYISVLIFDVVLEYLWGCWCCHLLIFVCFTLLIIVFVPLVLAWYADIWWIKVGLKMTFYLFIYYFCLFIYYFLSLKQSLSVHKSEGMLIGGFVISSGWYSLTSI